MIVGKSCVCTVFKVQMHISLEWRNILRFFGGTGDRVTKLIRMHGRATKSEKEGSREQFLSSIPVNLTLDHAPGGMMVWRATMLHRNMKRTGRKMAVKKNKSMKKT